MEIIVGVSYDKHSDVSLQGFTNFIYTIYIIYIIYITLYSVPIYLHGKNNIAVQPIPVYSVSTHAV